MDSTKSGANFAPTIDLRFLRLTSAPERPDHLPLTLSLDEEPSGYFLITKDDLNEIQASQQSLLDELEDARAIINHLKEQLDNKAPVTSSSNQFEELMELNRERRLLTDRVAKAREEASHYRQETEKLRETVDSYEEDYNALLADYNYLEDLYKRTRKLFTTKISEVFRMQCELREVRIRPKAPEGCLNCNTTGHSFRSCQKPYNGRFCQKCFGPDFNTEECPWPHFAEGKFDVPENRRCKVCRRPKNLPDANCGDCRKRMIEDGVIKRNQAMQEIENGSSRVPLCSCQMNASKSQKVTNGKKPSVRDHSSTRKGSELEDLDKEEW